MRCIKWSKTSISQTVFNSFPINSRVPESPGCLSPHCEFDLSLHTREFNLSHMPNPSDTNKIKVVRVFDSACTNVVSSLAELYYLWYVLATLVWCSLQLLLENIITSN